MTKVFNGASTASLW